MKPHTRTCITWAICIAICCGSFLVWKNWENNLTQKALENRCSADKCSNERYVCP